MVVCSVRTRRSGTAADRKLKAPDQWWYVLTDNTQGSGDETGIFDAEVQDASTLDRIDTVIEVPYLGKPEERKVLMKKFPSLEEELVNRMIDVAKMVRTAFRKQTLMSTMETTNEAMQLYMLAWYILGEEPVMIAGSEPTAAHVAGRRIEGVA